jgi:arylsulfatase A-like enzyme
MRDIGIGLLLGLLSACSSRPSRPDVVVVLIDTLRADHLSFYGHERETAPFLAELAAGGVVFENAWAPSSWTAPSTASLFTGVYPDQHGVTTGLWVHERYGLDELGVPIGRLPEELQTLPELMRSLGYRTFAITDNRNICEDAGFARGFDRFANFHYAGAEKVNEVLDGWADEITASESSFVYLHYIDPHQPYHAKQPWMPPGDPDQRVVRYDSEIGYVDHHIGLALERIGVDEDTLVIVVADHGEEFGDHGDYGHRLNKLYGELTRIPLVVRQPGVAPTRSRVAEHVSLLDVLPTLRQILGAPASTNDMGRSLTDYFVGGPAPEPRTIFSMRTWIRPERQERKWAVVRGRHKYVFADSGTRELFDLVDDPGEQRNLWTEGSDVARSLQSAWDAFAASAPVWTAATAEVRMTEQDIETLEALGYTGKD